MHRYVALALLLVGCQAGAPLGTTCASSAGCASPLVCRLGRCRNECVGNRDCPLGAQCFLDGTGLGACQLDADRSCGTDDCGAGLTCLGSTCVRACSGATDCPSDGTCTLASGASIGVCTDLRGTTDAGTPDAASAPDTAIDAGPGCAPLNATALCVGDDFACAIQSDHGVMCWGNGQSGILGVAEPSEQCVTTVGSFPCHALPASVPLEGGGRLTTAVEITCGDSFACARLEDGHVRCWGRNFDGMLGAPGDGMVGAREVVDAGGIAIEGATAIAAGAGHVCALTGAGVVCWGENESQQLGRGPTAGSGAPAVGPQFATVGAISDVVAMTDGTCVVHGTELHCLGANTQGELGIAAGMPSVSPSLVHLDHVTLAAAPVVVTGQFLGCALDASGHAQCWGLNDYGSLGRVEHAGFVDPLPAPLYGAASALVFTNLWAGHSSYTVCGASGADLWCWGNDATGQAAQDPSVVGDAVYATRIAGIDHVQDAACSQTECCAIDGNGVVRCWGGNLFGQLGRGIASTFEWMPATVCAH